MRTDKQKDIFTAVPFNGLSNAVLDNIANIVSYNNVTTPPLTGSAQFYYGGAFSGAADAVRQRWSKARTPTVFRNVATAALGSTVIWTPGVGNKFRLLKYVIQLSANATIAIAGLWTVTFLDAAGATNLTHQYFIPAAALAGNNFPALVIDLGYFGVLSALANNALNVSLSLALATGQVNVIAMGTEE